MTTTSPGGAHPEDRVLELESEVLALKMELVQVKADQRVPVSVSDIVTGICTLGLVFIWLTLATRIIWSASSNPEILDSVENLLLPLAILGGPATAIFGYMYGNNQGKKNGGNGEKDNGKEAKE